MVVAASRLRPAGEFGALAARVLPAVLYGVRLATAVSAALFIAFYLQLDTPSWAGTSACIVCQPIVGSSVRKGLFRMIGTAIGAVVSVLLTAAFPQDRVGFLFMMLLWASACTFVSTLLRNFAAYAAVLAGYTLIIIAASSIAAPDRVFDLAIGRASEICVGIVCGTLVMALTDLGTSPRRLSLLLSQLTADTADHLAEVLAKAGTRHLDGPDKRRALIKRVAELDAVIDQAVGESTDLLHRRSELHAAMNGLFDSLSGVRVVETHFRNLPPAEARHCARLVLDRLPPDWQPTAEDDPVRPRSALERRRDMSIARDLLRQRKGDLSVRLTLEGVADAVAGLAAAANGLAILDDPAEATDLRRKASFAVADFLPAVVNAVRVFLGVGAVVLFWIVTAWPNGLQAILFAAVTIMIVSPMQETSGKAAAGLGIGTLIAAIVVAILQFVFLPNHDTFLAFSLILASALVPLGALSTVPLLAPYLLSSTMNFIPLFAPTNLIVYDTSAYLNSAIGLLSGCAVGVVALLVFPAISPRVRSQRLVDLSIRDLRRLAGGRRHWTLRAWQNRLYARLTALPEAAEPVQRSYLVSTLAVGIQLIRLQRLHRAGRIGAELRDVQTCLAAGDITRLRAVLDTVDQEIAALPADRPGVSGRLRARSALLIIREAIDRHRDYFEGRPP
jgi:uncharacterized membrane protein YccC